MIFGIVAAWQFIQLGIHLFGTLVHAVIDDLKRGFLEFPFLVGAILHLIRVFTEYKPLDVDSSVFFIQSLSSVHLLCVDGVDLE